MVGQSRESIISLIEKYIKDGRLDWAQVILCQELKKEIDSWDKNRSIDLETYVAHYTNAETIYSLIKSEGKDKNKNKEYDSFLRLYDVSSLNDPEEGKHLKGELEKDYTWLKSTEPDTDAFICSFVCGEKQMGDKLTYWKSYGGDGLGCSIQLSKDSLRKKLKSVQYGKDCIGNFKTQFKIFFELGTQIYNKHTTKKEKNTFSTEFWKAFDKIKFLYKNASYKDEKECRYVAIVPPNPAKIKYHFRSEGPYLRRYIEVEELRVDKLLITGSKIFIGPRVVDGDGICQKLQELAHQSELYGPIFTSSKISYRKVW